MHVFIVNEKTFKYHLEYMFVGTGAGDRNVLFLDDPETKKIHSTTERNLVGMIADISKVRQGDRVIFYLTGAAKFYGFFRVADIAFYDKKIGNYLNKELNKLLSFRVLIEPDKVYAKGITEHECLDSLSGIHKPHQLCWSLIYRKLKGNRGCTMIFDYEANRIQKLIEEKNDNKELGGSEFTYDDNNQKIINSNVKKTYNGNQYPIDILKRLIYKEKNQNAFEVHLQAFIMQRYDSGVLEKLLFSDNCWGKWIGNEVSCGVGMQRIDVMTICENENNIFIKIIELKHTGPYIQIIENQLGWYVEWCIDYVVPNYDNKNKTVVIQPTILARKIKDMEELKKECKKFGYNKNKLQIEDVSYIGFDIKNENIIFEKVF